MERRRGTEGRTISAILKTCEGDQASRQATTPGFWLDKNAPDWIVRVSGFDGPPAASCLFRVLEPTCGGTRLGFAGRVVLTWHSQSPGHQTLFFLPCKPLLLPGHLLAAVVMNHPAEYVVTAWVRCRAQDADRSPPFAAIMTKQLNFSASGSGLIVSRPSMPCGRIGLHRSQRASGLMLPVFPFPNPAMVAIASHREWWAGLSVAPGSMSPATASVHV